jgi:hypothetical protein
MAVQVHNPSAPGVSVYLESDAAAGVATGQTDPSTAYQDLCDLDGTATEAIVPEDGLYEIVRLQGAGDLNGTSRRPIGRLYRVSDNLTLLERGWGPADVSTAYGVDEANFQAWVSDHTDVGAGDPIRGVPLNEGDVLRYQIKINSGVLDLNRDLTLAMLRKIGELP